MEEGPWESWLSEAGPRSREGLGNFVGSAGLATEGTDVRLEWQT
jgi:hypothetical protein